MLYKNEGKLERASLYSNPKVSGVYWEEKGKIRGYSLDGLVVNFDANSFSMAEDAQNASSFLGGDQEKQALLNYNTTPFKDLTDYGAILDTHNPQWTILKDNPNVNFALQDKTLEEITIRVKFRLSGELWSWRTVFSLPSTEVRLEMTPRGFAIFANSESVHTDGSIVIDRLSTIDAVIRIVFHPKAKSLSYSWTIDGYGKSVDGVITNLNNTNIDTLAFLRRSPTNTGGAGNLNIYTLQVWTRRLSDLEVTYLVT